jgi:CheY-like chemotaxis protein
MSHASHVRGRALTYGLDRRLLKTRELLLKADGYATDLASTPQELQTLLRSGAKYDVVVLCHTASAADRRACELASRALPAPLAVYAMTGNASPGEFLKEVSRLTGKGVVVR